MTPLTVLTNESNPATLKLLICSKLGGKSVEIIIVDIKGILKKHIAQNVINKCFPDVKNEPKRLPILQLESGENIFISNAAARYLFSPIHDLKIDEWLEWESSVLRPILVNIFGQTKINDGFKSALGTALKKIDSVTKYLTGDSISAADLTIWSSLYPISTSNELKLEYLSSFNNVTNWLQRIETLPEIQNVLTEYKMNPGVKSYMSLSIGERLLSNVVNSIESSTGSPVEDDSVTADELEAAKQAWLKQKDSLPKPKPIANPILPIPGEKNILITSALPYVNNVPHLGNIIGCVLSADVFARFCRLCNYNTVYICGTDEYGTATETKALEEKLSPQEICDKYFQIHNTIYRWFGIGFDYFGRTTTPEQTKYYH